MFCDLFYSIILLILALSANIDCIVDIIDQKILRSLQINGRLTNLELAKEVGLSPSPCLRRVRALEERGILTGYTALIDQNAYGLPINVFVSVRLEQQSNSVLEGFEKAINDFDEVLDCYLMTGTRDYLLRVVCENLDAYELFVRSKLTTIDGVASIESSFALGRVKKRSVLPALGPLKGISL